MELTQEELDMLTPEERQAFEDDTTQEDDADADTGAAKPDADAAAAAAAGNPSDQADDEAARQAALAAADDEAAEALAKNDQEQQQQPPKFQAGSVPLIRPGETDDAEARIAELEAQAEALAEKFDNGDLTTSEFLKEQRSINRQISRIEQDQFRTQLSQETTQAQQATGWNQSVETFLNAHPELSTSNLRLHAFDAVLRSVTGNEENHGKSDQQLLSMAREQWAQELGVSLEPAAKADKPAAKPATEKKPSATDRPATPSLADAPAAAPGNVDDGRFANLDRLANTDPIAFENELARLSPTARDEYLQFAG